jgi:hypothetical protein
MSLHPIEFKLPEDPWRILIHDNKELPILLEIKMQFQFQGLSVTQERKSQMSGEESNTNGKNVAVGHNSCGVTGQCPGTEQSEDAPR